MEFWDEQKNIDFIHRNITTGWVIDAEDKDLPWSEDLSVILAYLKEGKILWNY